jgi:hypothetical protein
MPRFDSEPRFNVQVEARGSIVSVAIRATSFAIVPLYAYRGGSASEKLPWPGIPTRGGLVIGTAGALGVEELAQALEAAAKQLRAAVSGGER